MGNRYSIFKSLFVASLTTFLAFSSFESQAAETMPEGTRVYPSGNNYVTYFTFLELTWDYEDLELIYPSEKLNIYDCESSTVPATLEIEGIEGSFNLYPYLDEAFLDYEETPDGDYNYIYGCVLAVDFYVDDLLSQLKLNDYPYGKYTISFPEGIVQNVLGEINPAQTVEIYFMDSPDFDTETFTPPAIDASWQPIDYAADDLKSVSLTWDMPMTINENSIPATVRQYSFIEETPRTPLVYGEQITLNEAGDALLFDLSTLPVGRWTVEFPAGYVFLGEDKNMINEETQATYTITTPTGISELIQDMKGRWTIFDINGAKILETGDKDQLKSLRPGLYIINGNKVIIRN